MADWQSGANLCLVPSIPFLHVLPNVVPAAVVRLAAFLPGALEVGLDFLETATLVVGVAPGQVAELVEVPRVIVRAGWMQVAMSAPHLIFVVVLERVGNGV